ncbi:MAG: hypothetical protein ABL864_06425 [Terricaulis sp.]
MSKPSGAQSITIMKPIAEVGAQAPVRVGGTTNISRAPGFAQATFGAGVDIAGEGGGGP